MAGPPNDDNKILRNLRKIVFKVHVFFHSHHIFFSFGNNVGHSVSLKDILPIMLDTKVA